MSSPAPFRESELHDVVIRDLKKHEDARGWLIEVHRMDEIEERYAPAMSYISMTNAGVARGPHEHVDQSDVFGFIGPSNFRIYLWDNRNNSVSRGNKMVFIAGVDAPRLVIVPPGVNHAYRNVGSGPGMVINLPNRLYAGRDKKSPVDEIRHENDPQSPFVLE